jgi:O-antigen ligase
MAAAAARLPNREAPLLTKLSRYVTAGAIALAPLPFGSAETQWVSLWCVLLCLALLPLVARPFRRIHLVLLAPAIGTLLVVIVACWLQSLPLPGIIDTDAVWARAQALVGATAHPPAAVDVAGPWQAFGPSLAIFLAFVCAFLHATDTAGAQLILRTVAVSALVYASYGIVAHLVDPTTLLWREKTAYMSSVTGTFVNRNTAATYFGSGALVWLLIMLQKMERRLPSGGLRLQGIAAAFLDEPPPGLIGAAAAWLCVVVALLMTQSRAGVLLSGGAMVAVAALYLKPRLTMRSNSLLVAGAIAGLLAILLEFWGGAIAYRIGTQGLTDATRSEAYKSTLAIIRDHPLLGTGLGTFPDVFPSYRSPLVSTAGVWDRTHNTPLELASEIGLPATAAVIALWGFVATRLVRHGLKRRKDRAFAIAGLGVGLLGTAHSLVDFSLQIPGYAIVFAAVAGCGLAQSVSSVDSEAVAARSLRMTAAEA